MLVLAACTRGAGAQTVRSASLAFDNDGFTFWVPPRQRTDWFYTHGTHLALTFAARPPVARLLGLQDEPLCEPGDGAASMTSACVTTRLRLAQEIYTPESLFVYSPTQGDRPYAGWLSVLVEAHRVAPDRSRAVGLELGVTGPPSGAGQAHLAIHRWLDKAEPGGWDYQIPFELAGALSVRETRYWPSIPSATRGSASVATSWGASLGTSRTAGLIGFGGRFGWNAPAGMESRGPGAPGGWVVAHVGTEAEFVAHDLFIDGSLWHDTVEARREPLVGRLRVSLRAGWDHVGLHLSVTSSSRAFARQSGAHTYGTLGLLVFP